MSSFAPIPLAIGFSGHRDISPDDEDALRAALRERLGDLRKASKSTPLRLFTGLAEGGDMLCAEAAVELGIEIIAVMPVEVADFVRDFEKPAHPDRNPGDLSTRFEKLHARAAHVHVVPIPTGVSPESVRTHGAERNAQYAAVGAYIVRQSAILIALWDGVAVDKPGGTGDVVRFKRDGVPPQPGETEYFPAPPDGGPVMQLGATRMGSVGDERPVFHGDSYPEPEQLYRREFKKALKRLQTYNRDTLRFARLHPQAVAASRGHVLPPDLELEPEAARALDVYAVTDALAISLQGWSRRILDLILGAAILMVIFFELYGHLRPFELWITAYIAVFVIACAIYAIERWCRVYERFLDYRCLAEGLRVQIFWHLAGLDEAVADHYLHRQRGELRWIRDALRSFVVRMPPAMPRLALVRKHWIADQAKYFTKSAGRAEDARKLTHRSSDILFGIGFAIAVMIFLSGLRSDSVTGPFSQVMILLVAFLPALAAAIKGYSVKRAFSEHAKQYARMARIFSLARKRLESVGDETLTERTRGVLLALGREALAENAEWILLHRERLIAPPI